MTYADLLTKLLKLSNEELEKDVTIFDIKEDEFYPACSLKLTGNYCDVLDERHPIIEIRGSFERILGEETLLSLWLRRLNRKRRWI